VTSLSLAVVLQMSLLATGENSYAEAHQQVLKTGEPMVVMVTADWCPACQTMKTTVLPQVQEHGLLRRVIFTIVNVDREQELGKRLVAGGPIPQLLMYRRTDDGWRLRRLIGGQSTATVEEFINQGIELGRKPAPPAPAQAEPQPTPQASPVSQPRTAAVAAPTKQAM
jgi:thiol-disulfide isomerase/thioredoxin